MHPALALAPQDSPTFAVPNVPPCREDPVPPFRYHLLAVGETLIDFISNDYVETLADAAHFQRYAGGEAANVARNVGLLGGNAAFAGCVGADGFGRFLRHTLQGAGVDTSHLQEAPAPTTLAVVGRNTDTPDFTIYRGADALITPQQIPEELIRQTRAVHVSAFALSREPGRSAVFHTLQLARKHQRLVSLDPNYHPSLWQPEETDPLETLQRAGAFADVVKPSLDDCRRLFGTDTSPDTCLSRLLAWGVQLVVLTMGARGVILQQADGSRWEVPARKVHVADVTGAGDAFWAAFLLALLDGFPPPRAAEAGQAFAAKQIATVGPLTEPVDRRALYRQLWGDAS